MARPRPPALLPASHALLLALVRGESAPDGFHENHLDPTRWRAALALAEAHGIAPLLHEEAQQGRLAGLPDVARQELRAIRIAELGRVARREQVLLRALAALGAEAQGALPALAAGRRELPVLLLKGAASARTLYAAPELRPRSDLDLLVAPVDRAEALARLERAGYAQHAKTRGTREDEPDWHERTLIDPRDRDQQLDLHFALAQPARHRLDAARLFAAAMREPRLGAAARILPPEEAALVCVHALAVHELSAPLVSLCDLARLLAKIDVARLLALARETRLRRALYVSCALLEQLAKSQPGAPRLAARGDAETARERAEISRVEAKRAREAAELSRGDADVARAGAAMPLGDLSFCGQQVEGARLGQLLSGCALSPLVQGLLQREARGYDLERGALARPRQLWRKALFIDRPEDAARFAGGHALQSLRRALRP